MDNITNHQVIHRYLCFFSCPMRVTVQVVVIIASSFSAAFPLRDSCTKRRVPEISTIVKMITTVKKSKSSGTLPKSEKIRENHIRNRGNKRKAKQNSSKRVDKCTRHTFCQGFLFSWVTLFVPYLERFTDTVSASNPLSVV